MRERASWTAAAGELDNQLDSQLDSQSTASRIAYRPTSLLGTGYSTGLQAAAEDHLPTSLNL
jgi:hypothetical protein